ncbi:MAG: hypothetical protein SGI84_09025 [Gemmatimonadota bacterium]|nr:hypothetical protein [Gemmatimonadota bacterium]
MNNAAVEDAEALLRAQLADLARFRHVIEAQRAVLRMEDAGLLGAFARETTDIADAVAARDMILMSLRSAAQREQVAVQHLWDPALESEVHKARKVASDDSLSLARQMESAAHDISKDLEGVGRRLESMVGQQYRRELPGQPLIVDRMG